MRLLLSVSMLAMLAACGPSMPRGAGGPASAGPGVRFVRSVYGIEVFHPDGTAMAHPFLGGLNTPRPQLVDIDADGDEDLFVQEHPGAIMFFEDTGGNGPARYRWRSDRYENLDVGEWYRFADLDADGDFDLLAEQRYGYIRVFLNEGTSASARFVPVPDTLRDAGGEPLFSDRQNIPNLTDLDCDGRLDFFVGRVTGTILHYESVGADRLGLPRFDLVTDRFEGIEIIGQIGSLHGANTLTFGDLDRDGDPDLLWGDFFEPGLLLIENSGTCARPDLRGKPVAWPVDGPISTSGYNAPAVTDYNADGLPDVVVGVLGGAFNPNRTAADNLQLYLQEAAGGAERRTTRLLDGIDVGAESIPAFTDLDGDGDFDLLLSNKVDPANDRRGHVYVFENLGTPRAPVFRMRDTLDLAASFHFAPALGDLDADGDPDLLLGTWRDMALYRNQGTRSEPRFVLEDASYLRLERGTNSTPAMVDLDGDGDLDVIAGQASGTLSFYRNIGTAREPRFEPPAGGFAGIDVGQRSAPAPVDLDGDGDVDLVVGSETEGLVWLRNSGRTGFVPGGRLPPAVPRFAAPAFADLDADGDPDLFVGGIGGGVLYFENRSGGRNDD